jgi:hypothetical protein
LSSIQENPNRRLKENGEREKENRNKDKKKKHWRSGVDILFKRKEKSF